MRGRVVFGFCGVAVLLAAALGGCGEAGPNNAARSWAPQLSPSPRPFFHTVHCAAKTELPAPFDRIDPCDPIAVVTAGVSILLDWDPTADPTPAAAASTQQRVAAPLLTPSEIKSVSADPTGVIGYSTVAQHDWDSWRQRGLRVRATVGYKPDSDYVVRIHRDLVDVSGRVVETPKTDCAAPDGVTRVPCWLPDLDSAIVLELDRATGYRIAGLSAGSGIGQSAIPGAGSATELDDTVEWLMLQSSEANKLTDRGDGPTPPLHPDLDRNYIAAQRTQPDSRQAPTCEQLGTGDPLVPNWTTYRTRTLGTLGYEHSDIDETVWQYQNPEPTTQVLAAAINALTTCAATPPQVPDFSHPSAGDRGSLAYLVSDIRTTQDTVTWHVAQNKYGLQEDRILRIAGNTVITFRAPANVPIDLLAAEVTHRATNR
ncbi:hypothetical protein [Nocardia tengchongensis]|uniref:hypothetical protein n=1 Tax=Nocardia tengchongensis TaxID=2055889 RepID=UPI00364BC7F4